MKKHKIVLLGYTQWHAWARELHDRGIRQAQCSCCGLWLFPEEE